MTSEAESHRTEDVLMLFRYTENPPENRFFASRFLRLGGLCMRYTEGNYSAAPERHRVISGPSRACSSPTSVIPLLATSGLPGHVAGTSALPLTADIPVTSAGLPLMSRVLEPSTTQFMGTRPNQSSPERASRDLRDARRRAERARRSSIASFV